MIHHSSYLRSLLLALVGLFAWGCLADVPATNPFDPEAPEELQRRVNVVGIALLDGADEMGHGEVAISLASTSFNTTTNADGTFRIDDVPEGIYTVRAVRDGYDTQVINGVVVRMASDTTLDNIILPRSLGQVSGRFQLADSMSSDGIVVALTATADGEQYTTLTGSNGVFRFDGLATGSYQVSACRAGYLPPDNLDVEVSANETASIAEAVMNRPNIRIAALEGDAFSASSLYRLAFDVPTDRVARIRVTGDADVLDVDGNPVEAQGEYLPFVTDDSGSYVDVRLSEGDGPKSLQVSFRGNDCYQSETYQLLVHLDSIGPSIIAAEFAQGTHTNQADVVLNLIIADAYEIKISGAEDHVAAVAGEAGNIDEWIAASDVLTVTLAEGEGRRVVGIQARDVAGNLSEPETLSIAIELDTVPPAVGLEIAGGASHTATPLVQLAITSADRGGSGVTEMAVADGAVDCDTARYQPYVDRLAWSLPVGEGNKTVAVCVRDAAGNTAQANARTILDTVAPDGTLSVPGEGIVSDRRVRLVFTRVGEDAVGIALEAGFTDCASEEYVPFEAYGALTGEDPNERWRNIQLPEGEHTLTLCLRDAAGNTRTIVESVRVDLTDPVVQIIPNDPNVTYYVTDRVVSMTTFESNDVRDMIVAQGQILCAEGLDGFDGWLDPGEDASTVTLPDNDGPHTLTVCVRDAAGRMSRGATKNFVLDRSRPVRRPVPNGSGLAILRGAPLTNQTNVELALAARDSTSGVAEYKLSEGAGCGGGVWRDWSGQEVMSVMYVLEEGDNVARTVSVQFRDAAGNESECVSDSITIDTIPLSLSSFEASSLTGNVDLTTERRISVGLTYSGTGTCERILVGESLNSRVFLEPTAECGNGQGNNGGQSNGCYEGCPAEEQDFILSGGNDIKTLYAVVVDAAGNVSPAIQRDIELDMEDPELQSLRIVPTPGADAGYVNDGNIFVELVGAIGGSRVVYQTFEEQRNNCPAAATLNLSLDYIGDLNLSFASDGIKTVCAAIVDEAGNSSPVRRIGFTLDTLAPSVPPLSPQRETGVNRACVNLTPAGDVDENFWKFQWRQLGSEWVDSFTAPDVAIAISLYQDSDNIIEVRAVDRAGNVGGVAQAFFEEVSSNFIPTNLQIKQICNGGQYAILKDMSVKHTIYRNKRAGVPVANIDALPQVALLNLETYAIHELSPGLSMGDLDADACDVQALYNHVIDAACSVRAGEPQLLVITPTDPRVCPNPPFGNPPNRANYVGTRALLFPDPIGNPLELGMELDDFITDDDGMVALVGVDALDWTDLDGDADFRAIGVTAQIATGAAIPGTSPFRYEVVRLAGDSDDQDITVSGALGYGSVSVDEGEPGNQNLARGLALWGSNVSSFLAFRSNRWRTYAYTMSTGSLVENTDFTSVLNERDDSPYNVYVGPAHFMHHGANPSEPRTQYIYMNRAGQAKARRGDKSNATGEQYLGGTIPAGGDRIAPFIEERVDYVNWIDADDQRLMYATRTYGSANESLQQRYRFTFDTSRGLFPYLHNGQAATPGQRNVLFHASGLNNGIVVGYKNETGCLE